MIQARNIVKVFGKGEIAVRALSGTDFNLRKGEFVAIQGPSGCGKSTLLNVIGCLEKPTSGRVLVDDMDVTDLEDEKLAMIRRDKIGFVFQSYNLIPTMNALENVMLPMIFARKSDSETVERATMLLEMVGMHKRMKHRPAELSGGEQQRVAVARALSNDPPIIIGDELTGNLDSKAGHAVMDILLRLNEEGRTIAIATHDSAVANRAHRIVYIKDGRFTDNERGLGA